MICCCITTHLETYWCKTINVSRLIVSVGRATRCGSAGASAQAPSRAAGTGGWGCPHLNAHLGKDPPPELSTELSAGLRAPPAAGTSVPCHMALSTRLVTTWWPAFHKTRALGEAEQDRGQWFCELISEVTSRHCCPVIFSRRESLGPAHPPGEGATQGRRTRRWGQWTHLRGCPPRR